MKKTRGFEKISQKQWEKDTKEQEIGENFDQIKSVILYDEIRLPERKTAYSAGYDIHSPISFTLKPGESIKIPTGIKAYMQYDEVLKFYPRSSQGFKYLVHLVNTVGLCDSDYHNNENNEGHIWVKLRNESGIVWLNNLLDIFETIFSQINIFSNIRKMNGKEYVVNINDGIAQAVFEKYYVIDGDDYGDGNLRTGGIGSTNK
jgi:dUTP pyrophosphatase